MARVRWDRPQEREQDVDTLRWQALRDAKGLVLREGVTFRGDGSASPWLVRRSVAGRTDQVDICSGGEVFKTLGRKQLRKILPGGLDEQGVEWRRKTRVNQTNQND